MSARVAPVSETVARCVPQQSGSWIIMTTKGKHGTYHEEIPEGSRIIIREGVVERIYK